MNYNGKKYQPTEYELDDILEGTIESLSQANETVDEDTIENLPGEIATTEIIPHDDTKPELALVEDHENPDVEEINDEKVQLEEDFNRVRRQLVAVVEQGSDIIRDASVVASGTDHPQAYSALANLINSVISANQKLIDIHATRQKLNNTTREQKNNKSQKEQNKGSITTNNSVVFNGIPKDIIEAIVKKK